MENFIFCTVFQIKGCAMGTICSLAYAKIFMANFESKFIYPNIKDFISIYKRKCYNNLRFNDDLFMIWTDTGEELCSRRNLELC